MIRKSKKKDTIFLDHLVSNAKKVKAYESNLSVLEQIIENILSEGESNKPKLDQIFQDLKDYFVDWNEVRIVPIDRLEKFFEGFKEGAYKLKVIQAILNKIFSRTGSLDYKFLIDFEADALEDYLAGIMEMKEDTRKRIILRVFKKSVIPVREEHERIFEKVGTTFSVGDEEMKKAFSKYSLETLEGIKDYLDTVLSKHMSSEKKFEKWHDQVFKNGSASKNKN